MIRSQAEVLGLSNIILVGRGEGLIRRRERRKRLVAERGALFGTLDDGGAIMLCEEGDLTLVGVGLLLGLFVV